MQLIDNKRNHIERQLSSAKRDQKFIDEAREDNKSRKDLAESMLQSKSSFFPVHAGSKFLNDVYSSNNESFTWGVITCSCITWTGHDSAVFLFHITTTKVIWRSHGHDRSVQSLTHSWGEMKVTTIFLPFNGLRKLQVLMFYLLFIIYLLFNYTCLTSWLYVIWVCNNRQ